MELAADLWGEVDGRETGLSGNQSLQKGKLLPKPKARMDTYRVGRTVFSFVASIIDAPLRVCNLKEHESLNLPVSTIQRFEQDVQVLTMVGSFLDCLGTMLTRPEAILNEGPSEGTCWLVGMLLELEHS